MPSFEEVETETSAECPYCGMPMEDRGEGFMRHLSKHPSCKAQFADFSDNLGPDTLGD